MTGGGSTKSLKLARDLGLQQHRGREILERRNMKNETLEKRVDAVTQIIYDPSGKQSGEYYPANSTHFFGKPIKSAVKKVTLGAVKDVALRLCASGKWCLRYEHGTAAPAKG